MRFNKPCLVSFLFLSASILRATPSWENLGGSFQGKPVVLLRPDGRLEAFARGTDNALWFASQTSPGGSWTPFASLGGTITSNPAAVTDLTGRIAVFALGTDSAVWTRSQITAGIDNYSDWHSIGGYGTSDLAVVQAPQSYSVSCGCPVGRAEVFMRGGDSSLWHTYQPNASDLNWAAWSSLGGYLTSAPGAGVDHHASITAFVRGGDNALWFIQETFPPQNTWTAWASLGGALSGPPDVSEVWIWTTLNQNEVTYRGFDNSAWYIIEGGDVSTGPTAWTNQTSLGGYVVGNPTSPKVPLDQVPAFAVSDREFFAVGGDNALWVTASFNNQPYGPWQSLGGFVVGDPFATRDQDGTIDVFAMAPDGTLWHIRQSAPLSWQ